MPDNEKPPFQVNGDLHDAIAAQLRRLTAAFGGETVRPPQETVNISPHKAHGACTYVEHEIGTSPDADVNDLQDFPTVTNQITDNIEAVYARSPRPLPGQSAKAALTSLGCATCRFVMDCPVREQLEVRASHYNLLVRVVYGLTDLLRSPRWLTLARQQRTGVDLDTYPDNTETGGPHELIVNDFREGVYAGVVDEGLVFKSDLPEIEHIAAIAEDAPLPALPIVAEKNGHKFLVIDATEALGSKDAPLSDEDEGILYAKLLGLISAPGMNGESQIMSPDGIQQKLIGRVAEGMLYEIRMSGKNRLYITLHAGSGDEDLTRIVILGGHGGDAATQRKFIDRILPRRS